MKPTKRKAFSFLRSYFDVLNQLEEDKDKLAFLLAIINKQFLDENPKDLNFICRLSYESQRHAIETSVKGYKSKTKDPMRPPCQGATEGVTKGASVQEEEKEKVEYTKPTILSKKEKIDWDKLREQFNEFSGKKTRVVSEKVKTKLKARIREGYTKQDMVKAMSNISKDQYHKDTNYKYFTLEFISRSDILDKYSTV